MAEKGPYYPPVGSGSMDTVPKEEKPRVYIPPVGPDSKSLPPSGDYRDLPAGFIPKIPKKK